MPGVGGVVKNLEFLPHPSSSRLWGQGFQAHRGCQYCLHGHANHQGGAGV